MQWRRWIGCLVIGFQLVWFQLIVWFTGRVENSVDPDQLASEKSADLDLHCFQNKIYIDVYVKDNYYERFDTISAW